MSDQPISNTSDKNTAGISGKNQNPMAPPASKLGRGLGRLIPVKNTQITPEKTNIQNLGAIDQSETTAGSIGRQAPIFKADPNTKSVDVKYSADHKLQIGKGVNEIQISNIRANPRQPRTDFKISELQALADSIKLSGLIQPIILRPLEGQTGKYEIVAGERRLRAFQILNRTTIPAIVVQTSDENSGMWALIENIHRADLNPMDRAMAVQKLAHEFSISHDKLAEKLSLDRTTVTNLLRLADLDFATAELVRKSLLSQGHAKALLGVLDLKTRSMLAESTLRGDWSVRTLEREVQRLSSESKGRVPRGTVPERRSANIKDLETRLSQLLGTRVSIHLGRKPNTGKVSMDFFSLDQFEGLLTRFGLRQDQIRIEN